MPRDATGTEIYPGDMVRCLARYYDHIRYGDTFEVRATGGNCIESDAMDKRYGFDAKFKGCNFEIVHYGPHNPMSGCNLKKGQTKMALNTPPLFIAVRIDGSPNMNVIAELIHANQNATKIMADVTLDGIQSLVRDDIRIHDTHQWLILSPLMIGETASQPVKFRSLRSL